MVGELFFDDLTLIEKRWGKLERVDVANMTAQRKHMQQKIGKNYVPGHKCEVSEMAFPVFRKNFKLEKITKLTAEVESSWREKKMINML